MSFECEFARASSQQGFISHLQTKENKIHTNFIPSLWGATFHSIRLCPLQEGELRKQQGELEEERQEVQRKKEEYQRDLERLRDAQRRLERDKDAVQRQLDKMEEARVAEVRRAEPSRADTDPIIGIESS